MSTLNIAAAALDPETRYVFASGLGGAFVLVLLGLLAFMLLSRIDHGFLGLMFLLTLLF